jgi:hypothetical protein
MRRALHSNNTATAIITLIFILSTCLFTISTAQTASLRCQKSGCREGDNNDESLSSPTIIVTKPKSNAFPTLISYITAFLLLRLGFRYMKKILPMLRDRIEILWPEVRSMIGHYHDYITNNGSTGGRRRGGSRSVGKSSTLSLGSLAEFVDSDHSVGSTTIGDDDNDSYSTKSGYSTETGTTTVGLSGLLSDNDTTTNTEAFNSRRQLAGKRRGSVGSLMNSVVSSAGTSYSSYDSEEDASTREGGGGTTISSRASILSKFLNYITDANNNGTATSSRHNQITQRERNGIYGQHNAHPKRRSSIDYSIFSSSNNNNNSSNDIEKQRAYKHDNYYSRSNNNDHQLVETTTRQRPRRSTVDDSFNHHHSTSTYLTSHHNTMTKDKSSNASINSSGIKMRKKTVVASAVAKEESIQIINDGSDKKKVHQMQQQSKNNNDNNNDDDDDKKKKKSSLHHHLSKFASSSSSKKNDDENYSTMMSTVDLRTRASVATGLSTK